MSRFDTQIRASGLKRDPNIPERRKSERFPFSAVAHIVEPHAQAGLSARISDISLYGCYADSVSAMPVGTHVNVAIEHAGAQLKTGATVTYSIPGMGMGLSFDKLSPDMESILARWIAEMSGEEVSRPVTVEEASPVIQRDPRVERQVLNRLIGLMVRKTLLTQSEGSDLIKELSREE